MTDSFASQVLDPVKLPFIFMAGPTYEQQMIIALRDLAHKGGKRVVLMHADNGWPWPGERAAEVRHHREAGLVDTVEFRYDAQDVTAHSCASSRATPTWCISRTPAPRRS